MAAVQLNAAQREAVQTLSGPLLVLAGAGTGKTRVITYRIAALMRSGVMAQRILAVTFTNKAAREMRERTGQLLGKRRKDAPMPEICTFHAWCVRVLRRHIRRLGYPEKFAIYDRGDQESLARSALREVRVSQDRLKPGELLAQIGQWKNDGVTADAAGAHAFDERQHLAAIAYERYQAALRAAGAVDFDDLLLLTGTLLDDHPEVRFAESSRFDHLLIDEYQDTNGLQYRAAKALAERHRNICVVGDDDQSIYAWRGAEVTHILNFHKDWPEAKVVRLEDNYRSRASILALANTLIRRNTTRHDKTLRPYRKGGPPPRFQRFEDESGEASAVVREIRQRVDPERSDRVPPSDIAILFRTNEQPRAFEQELRRAKIPYRLVGGQSFYDRKEVKDLLCYLRVIAHPRDEVSLLRIINTPPRGISTGSVQTLMGIAVQEGKPLWEVLPHAEGVSLLTAAAAARVAEFRTLIESFIAREHNEPLSSLVQDLVATIDYRRELERSYKNPADVDARWQSVQELINAIAQFEAGTATPSLVGFIEETALGGRDDNRDSKDKREEHAVTLMTLHSAKGLEFPIVYMVGLEEGLLPHKRAVLEGGRGIEEERRLCYVGVTRARDELTLTLCKGRMKWGKQQAAIPSRFLLEMRGELERAARAAEASLATLAQPAAPRDPKTRSKAVRARAVAASRPRAAKKLPSPRPAKKPPAAAIKDRTR